ncbi:MAG: MlaD family protein [Thermoleophilaceae bacterium]
MRRSGGTASIVASPVLVGAVTLLVVIVGVFLAYNANNGLPFVPTYDIKAQLPNGQKLVRGNEVRVGGFRVGVVSDVKPAYVNGKSIAVVGLKLEKTIQPLAKDTIVGVRPRSSLGLKYIEIVPGKAKASYRPGDTIPLSKAKPQGIEYEDLFSTFDKRTRANSRTALKGFGDAFAGRGSSINEAIHAFNPFFLHLTPVMQTLSAKDTHLENFFKNIGHASAEVAPVAKVQADVFGKMATTFKAFSHCPGCLQQTIAKSPPTLQSGIDSFKVQEPFLADFTTLSRKLRPVASTFHRSLGTINSALETGTPVLKRTPIMNAATEDVFRALDYLSQQPQTLLALKDLHTTFAVGRPLLEYVAPFNSVCNDATAFFTGLSTHMSMGVANGTSQNIQVKTDKPNGKQQHTWASADSQRPADVPSNWDPQTAMDQMGNHYETLHGEAYSPAVDAQGNADCQAGQYGYMNGPFNLNPKYAPAPIASGEDFNDWENSKAGGSHTMTRMDHPGLAGPTYVGGRLGITNLKDVP